MLAAGVFAVGAAVFMGVQTTRTSEQMSTLAETESKQLAIEGLQSTVRSLRNLCAMTDEILHQQCATQLDRAEQMLKTKGGVRLDGTQIVEWEAVNQLDKKRQRVGLPLIRIGETTIEHIEDPAQKAIFVDEITDASGAQASLFQRINPEGDMLRIATSVRNESGKRAVGSSVSAKQPDGTPNPVLAAVLAGKRYAGRAFVVDAWSVTSYAPLFGPDKEVIGMMGVGIPEAQAVEQVKAAIASLKVGKTGYAYVLQSSGPKKGAYVVSFGRKRDGEVILDMVDADGSKMIQVILAKAEAMGADGSEAHSYAWKNANDPIPAKKVAVFMNFKPWDWVVAAGTTEKSARPHKSRSPAR